MNIDEIKGKLVDAEDTIQTVITELTIKAQSAERLDNLTEFSELLEQIGSLENIIEELGLTRRGL